MIKFNTDNNYFIIERHNGYDNQGLPELSINIVPGPGLINLQKVVTDLQTDVYAIQRVQFEEAALIAAHPSLKDAHDQYKSVLGLVKNPPSDENQTNNA